MINLFGALANTVSGELEAESAAIAVQLSGENDSTFADCLACIFGQSENDSGINGLKETHDDPVEGLVDKKSENDEQYLAIWQMNMKTLESYSAETFSSDGQSSSEQVKKLDSDALVGTETKQTEDLFNRGMSTQPQTTRESRATANSEVDGEVDREVDGEVTSLTVKPERFLKQGSSGVDLSKLERSKLEHPDNSGSLGSFHEVWKAELLLNSEAASRSTEQDFKSEMANASRPVSEGGKQSLQDSPAFGMETAMQAAASGNSSRLVTFDRYAPGNVRIGSNQLFSEQGEFSSPTDFVNPLREASELNSSEVQIQSRAAQGNVGDTETQFIRSDAHSRQDYDSSSMQFTNTGIESKSFEQTMEIQRESEITPIAESIIGQMVSGLAVNEIQDPARMDDTKREIIIQIHPEELGQLEIKIESGDNGMTAEIWASEALTSDLLNREREALMDALREKGIELPTVNISHQQTREGESDSRQSGSDFQFSSGQKKKPVSPEPTVKRFNESNSQVNVIA